MPHKIATFFRRDSNNFTSPTDVKIRPATNRSPASSTSSLVAEEVKMPDSHKRLSFPNLNISSPKTTPKPAPSPASLNVVIESPPLVYYGPAATSSGALLSGQLKLNILHSNGIPVDSLKMQLNMEVVRKKPFHNHCPDCLRQTTELAPWTFLAGPASIRKGEHNFPFSFLLPGSLPASMKSDLTRIEYVLRATMTTKTGEPIKITKVLDVKRAIYPSETPRNSIRIFPPTNLTATCTLPPVIHPIGETTVSMRLDGIVKNDMEKSIKTIWKLKRVIWRIDEVEKQISPACAKHCPKTDDPKKKGMPHQDVRTIAADDLKSGWKSDYGTADGTVDLEFPIALRNDAKPVCDVKSEDGTEVTHLLIMELIVCEDSSTFSKPKQVTPSGAARVLRMHFNLTLTERAGLGISWDEEQPPLYENVPASPPVYGRMSPYEGAPIPDYEDLEPLDATQFSIGPGPSTTS